MTRREILRALPASFAGTVWAQGKYSGPRPPKKDIPYLLQADKLIQTELQEATTSTTKEGKLYSVAGATSFARTPLPEPIFLFSPDKIRADQMGLYRFEVKDGRRQIISGKHRSEDDPDLRITLRPLDAGVYRIEASQMLDPGEYSLSPEGAQMAFCFTVY
jgi:hypothetical protein